MSLQYADSPLTQQERDSRRGIRDGNPTGKLKQVIDLIILDATPWRDACNQVGLSLQSFQNATRKPIIVSYIRQRHKAHREALCAANAAVTAQIRDDPEANAAARLAAVKLLNDMNENVSDVATSGHDTRFTVQIVNRIPDMHAAAPLPQVIDATAEHVAGKPSG